MHSVHAVAAQHLCWALAVVAAMSWSCWPAFAQSAVTKSPATLQGKLLNAGDAVPVLKTQSQEYRLAARTDWLLHTLQDKRLAGREIRVEGELQADGKFKVNHFFTLRDGKVYRVRYFCEVCNIEALEPGKCVCCQQPTELQEIPVEKRN
jgi:hypothetical protein